MVFYHNITWRYNPEDLDFNPHRREKLEPLNTKLLFAGGRRQR
jgi:hypothetical protein